jgi:hypothetical protein
LSQKGGNKKQGANIQPFGFAHLAMEQVMLGKEFPTLAAGVCPHCRNKTCAALALKGRTTALVPAHQAPASRCPLTVRDEAVVRRLQRDLGGPVSPVAHGASSPEKILHEIRRHQSVLLHLRFGSPEHLALRRWAESRRKPGALPRSPDDEAWEPMFPPEETEYWVEIELVDEGGRPMPGARYEIELPGGRKEEGKLGGQGNVKVTSANQGRFQVGFPGLQPEAWDKWSENSSGQDTRIEIVDEAGNPLPWLIYRIESGAAPGTRVLGSGGEAELGPLSGSCALQFPFLDADEWELTEEADADA